jgi:hypothetical protein
MDTILDMTHQEIRTPMPPEIMAGSGTFKGGFWSIVTLSPVA